MLQGLSWHSNLMNSNAVLNLLSLAPPAVPLAARSWNLARGVGAAVVGEGPGGGQGGLYTRRKRATSDGQFARCCAAADISKSIGLAQYRSDGLVPTLTTDCGHMFLPAKAAYLTILTASPLQGAPRGADVTSRGPLGMGQGACD